LPRVWRLFEHLLQPDDSNYRFLRNVSFSQTTLCRLQKKQNAILRSTAFTTPNIMAHNHFLEKLSSGSSIHGYLIANDM